MSIINTEVKSKFPKWAWVLMIIAIVIILFISVFMIGKFFLPAYFPWGEASMHEGFLGQQEMNKWKTYRNEKYGFEFKYPYKNIRIGDCGESREYLTYNDLIYVECMYVVPPSYYAPDYDGFVGVFDSNLIQTQESVGFKKQVLSTINYNGVSWTILPHQIGSDYITERNGKTIWIVHAETIPESDFDQILSTFKFN